MIRTLLRLTKDFAPQVEVLEVHSFLESIERKFKLEALINIESGVGSNSQVLYMFGEVACVHLLINN